MTILFANNASSLLSTTLNAGATSVVLTSGAAFPEVVAPDYFIMTLQNNTGVLEYVKVTAHTAASSTFTIERAQEGTNDVEFTTVAESRAELRLTAGVLDNIRTSQIAAHQYSQFVRGVDSGSSTDTYELDVTPAITSYSAGLTVLFMPPLANVGPSTVTINGVLPAQDITYYDGTALGGNAIRLGRPTLLHHNGAGFVLSTGGLSANDIYPAIPSLSGTNTWPATQTFSVPIVGDVVGDVTGDVTAVDISATGTITGDLVGDVTGDLTGDLVLGSDTDGDMYYRDSGALVRLPIGANSEVLTTAGSLPTWKPTPSRAFSYGTGADGAKTVSVDENASHGSYHYTTYTVDALKTVTAVDGLLVIRATTSITINGAIDAKGYGGEGAAGRSTDGNGANGQASYAGGSGGGGGSGGSATIGGDGGATLQTPGGLGVINGHGLVGAAQATAALRLMIDQQNFQMSGNPVAPFKMGGGGGGAGGRKGGTSGSGGGGGGLVVLIAPLVTIGGAGSIDADGADGNTPTSSAAGGGGGGGGGRIIIVTPTSGYTDGSGGGVHAVGGAGNTTLSTYDGGDGGDGYVENFIL